MDRHIKRAEVLGEDSLGIELSESCQRGEVAVEKGQSVVIIFEVEAFPHSLGQLIDKTEFAVVVTGANPVEDRRIHANPQRSSCILGDDHLAIDQGIRAVDDQLDDAVVDELLVFNDIKWHNAINGKEFVADE